MLHILREASPSSAATRGEGRRDADDSAFGRRLCLAYPGRQRTDEESLLHRPRLLPDAERRSSGVLRLWLFGNEARCLCWDFCSCRARARRPVPFFGVGQRDDLSPRRHSPLRRVVAEVCPQSGILRGEPDDQAAEALGGAQPTSSSDSAAPRESAGRRKAEFSCLAASEARGARVSSGSEAGLFEHRGRWPVRAGRSGSAARPGRRSRPIVVRI